VLSAGGKGAVLTLDYKPQDAGARCSDCPLHKPGSFRPVPPFISSRAKIALVGGFPSAVDRDHRTAFVGEAGKEIWFNLEVAGYKVDEVSLFYSVACEFPGGKFHRRHRKSIECCHHRLLSELDGYEYIMSMGNIALGVLRGTNAALADVRGMTGSIEIFGKAVHYIATYDPQQVNLSKRLRHPFQVDLDRMHRWAS
jgi:uracil-DNA glycosylase family 4